MRETRVSHAVVTRGFRVTLGSLGAQSLPGPGAGLVGDEIELVRCREGKEDAGGERQPGGQVPAAPPRQACAGPALVVDVNRDPLFALPSVLGRCPCSIPGWLRPVRAPAL